MATTNLHESTDTEGAEGANQTSLGLIARAKENDSKAWERMVKLYSPLVYFWCKESGLPEPDLNDVFQEVFHTLARNIKKFRPVENGTFRGWLRTLTRNKLNDHYRKLGREPRPIGGTEALHYFGQLPAAPQRHSTSNRTEAPQNEMEIQHSMLCQALANVRCNFAEQTWKAFWMVVIDGRQTNDVAKDLSMRPGTVRVAKSRILKRLRQEIGDAFE